MCFTVLKSSGSGTWKVLSGSRVGAEDVDLSIRMLWMLSPDVVIETIMYRVWIVKLEYFESSALRDIPPAFTAAFWVRT